MLLNFKLTRSKNKGCHESILASTWPKFVFIQLLIYANLLINSWEICMQVKKQQLELDMEQQTASKLGKEYVKAVYYHPAYLT